eukprot:CAMPEP_0185033408 /NCGR_PEP_ID=MMETSP1103-20130426/22336_1 /TAXON_ID=36769 /ORGANISM="Paraphysomonas bandaiensis, Strain Caron Lab Isolate" /LENGTH=293 /DNA_ID=CAMNT_0027569671 /DNA_START=29 /DNA_END=910 /DNA_ORIENTATION=+
MSETVTRNEQWTTLNVALVQYPLIGGLSVSELSEKVKAYVTSASVKGSNLVMLPELFSLDMLNYSQPEITQFDQIIDDIYPKFIDEMMHLAVEYNIYILLGSVPAKVNGNIRNRAYLFGPNRESVYQEKIFLTPDEKLWGWEGSDTLAIINAPWGTTAIVICYDSEFPMISQMLAEQNVDLVLIPSMTGESGFTRVRWAAQGRAIEHMAYVLVTGTVGCPAEGWEMKAQAAALGPSLPGVCPLIGEGNMDAEDVLFASLDFTQLANEKSLGQYYPAEDQRNREFPIMKTYSNL